MASILPITITADDSRYFAVEADGRKALGLGFDEMLGTIVALAHPEVETIPGYMRGAGSAEAGAGRADVTITLPLAQAEALSDGLADLLCWCRGFAASAAPESVPMGVEQAREVRIAIDAAIARAKGIEPKEYPF